MSETVIIPMADDGTRALVHDLVTRAEDAWSRKASPAAVLQAIHARLDPADTDRIRRAIRLSLLDEAGGPEARAIVAGGLRARCEALVAQDADLLGALAEAYGRWPLTARILHAIRLLRAPAGAGAIPEDMRAPVVALIGACDDADGADHAPFEMRHGFLTAAAASDRLPAETRETALAVADRLALRTQVQVPPSILLRSLARSASATRGSSPTAWARACIADAEIAPRLSDPALVHLAALALFRETGIGLGGALALLKDAAEASLLWQRGEALEAAFATAPGAQDAGMVCRDLLTRPGAARARNRKAPAEKTPRPEPDQRPKPLRGRTGTRGRASEGAVRISPEGTTTDRAAVKPSLAERQGGAGGEADAGMRAATRRAAARLLTRLRLKNAAKDKAPS